MSADVDLVVTLQENAGRVLTDQLFRAWLSTCANHYVPLSVCWLRNLTKRELSGAQPAILRNLQPAEYSATD